MNDFFKVQLALLANQDNYNYCQDYHKNSWNSRGETYLGLTIQKASQVLDRDSEVDIRHRLNKRAKETADYDLKDCDVEESLKKNQDTLVDWHSSHQDEVQKSLFIDSAAHGFTKLQIFEGVAPAVSLDNQSCKQKKENVNYDLRSKAEQVA